MCPKLTELLSWNGPTVHVCCFMLARASTKTFINRIHIRQPSPKNSEKNLRQPKNSLAMSLVGRGIASRCGVLSRPADRPLCSTRRREALLAASQPRAGRPVRCNWRSKSQALQQSHGFWLHLETILFSRCRDSDDWMDEQKFETARSVGRDRANRCRHFVKWGQGNVLKGSSDCSNFAEY